MKNVLFVITVVGILLSAQFGFSAMVNLEGTAAPDTVAGKANVEAAVRDEGKKDTLASNEKLTGITVKRIAEDTTISPRIFSDVYATGQTENFAEEVSGLNADEFAVIIAMNMSPDEIKKAIDGKVNLGKVVIVEATTAESRDAFAELLKQNKEGFSLRALDRNSPVVVKAMQGAV